jgi:hypothetical protein
MPRLKLQVEAIQVVSFAPGAQDGGVEEVSLRCTTDCVVTGGIDSCWCSEYYSCDCV